MRQNSRLNSRLDNRADTLDTKHSSSKTLHLEIATIDFKTVASLRKLSETFWTPVEFRHRALACSATIETADGQFVMAELSGKSMNINQVDFIGGNYEKPHPLSSGEDLFAHFYREAKEEANLDPEDFKTLTLKAIIQTQRGIVIVYFAGLLNLTTNELKAKFATQKEKDPDIARLVFLSREEYLEKLKERWIGGVVEGLV